MGNTRRFRAGRQAKVLSLKERLQLAEAEAAYQQGYNQALQAQLQALKMERPPDLEEWIESVALPDMSDEEREAYESMDEQERKQFLDELGRQINATKALAES